MWASASLTVHGSRVGGRGTRRFQSAARRRETRRSRIAYSRRVGAMTSFFLCRISLAARALLGERGLARPERRVLGRDHVEDDRLLRARDSIELADEVLDGLDPDTAAAHGLRDPSVVVAPELGGDEPVAAAALSVLHPAEHAVVEHDRHDRDLVLRGGEQGVHRHREGAVAADGDTVALRARETV